MRLFVPSWLVPGSWLPNVEAARALGWAGGVELLLFSFQGDDRDLFLSELPGIKAASRDLAFTVHLPDPLLPAHEEIVGLTREFVEAYVVHPPRGGEGAPPALEEWTGLVGAWRGRWGDDFLLEYTGAADFGAAAAALPGLPACADTGRLLADNIDPLGWIEHRAGIVGEVHLHGAEGGRDHRPLSGREPWLGPLLSFLEDAACRVELEVFSLAGVETSRGAMECLR